MAAKIRTLGEGKLNITDTTNARDFSGDVTKVAVGRVEQQARTR